MKYILEKSYPSLRIALTDELFNSIGQSNTALNTNRLNNGNYEI